MSINRWSKRVDTVQPAIVKELRQLGIEVIVISKPVDLLCRLYQWVQNRWALIELKTPTKSGKIRKRKDQFTQDEFKLNHNVPSFTTTEQVLEYLKSR